jgi:hypothetical protein
MAERKSVYGLGRRLATRLPNSGSDTVNLYVNDYLGPVPQRLRWVKISIMLLRASLSWEKP